MCARVAARDRCNTCHDAPKNDLHKALSVGCDKCHKTEAWKPATLARDKFFPLDKDHNATSKSNPAKDSSPGSYPE